MKDESHLEKPWGRAFETKRMADKKFWGSKELGGVKELKGSQFSQSWGSKWNNDGKWD